MSQEDRTAQAGPLTGYRVLDFGWVLAGALPGMVLADMGADINEARHQDAARRDIGPGARDRARHDPQLQMHATPVDVFALKAH